MIDSVLLETRRSEDCGCPEEEWVINGLLVTMHGEEDGTGHIIIDAGDWDHEILTETADLGGMRKLAEDWIVALPDEE